MANFLNLVKKRTSVRDFTEEKIEDEKLAYIMESIRLSPSAVNFQPWHFIIVKGEENVAEISKSYNRDWFRTAPVCVVACVDYSKSWVRKDDKNHGDIDLAIAITHLTMAATDVDLGTCWVCNFHVDICQEVMNLPKHLSPVALIPIGYPTNKEIFNTNEKKRKTKEEIFSYWNK